MNEVVTILNGSKDKARVEAEAKKLGISVSAFICLLIKQRRLMPMEQSFR